MPTHGGNQTAPELTDGAKVQAWVIHPACYHFARAVPFRFFESLQVDQITLHFTFVPCHDGERRKNSTLLSVALATGLSMSDLDDIRLSVAAFRLESKFASPTQLINMISAHFIRQVSCHSLATICMLIVFKTPTLIVPRPMPKGNCLL